jgi:hypothetical protein
MAQANEFTPLNKRKKMQLRPAEFYPASTDTSKKHHHAALATWCS